MGLNKVIQQWNENADLMQTDVEGVIRTVNELKSQEFVTKTDLNKLVKDTDRFVETTSAVCLMKAEEKDTEIIEKLEEVKDELITVNQDSQSKINIILNELEEIKNWKKQKEEEDNQKGMKENDFYENNGTPC